MPTISIASASSLSVDLFIGLPPRLAVRSLAAWQQAGPGILAELAAKAKCKTSHSFAGRYPVPAGAVAHYWAAAASVERCPQEQDSPLQPVIDRN
ncbi:MULTISPECIES: hypothetical protein [unclassified Mesorhizobium]|uniref:hypothetical protein n=1 Tax=unclassified Mesorhizobium TaxID=325217 RepID=UPI00112C7421|nr:MULTISPECIES: hypothetical protein [unclassified Mesorhizobium]TPK92150.1 hypothetical protein FJ567_28095 [Mesorhizobium sp. B2-4-16]TPL59155.1 hypothetical protein FJ956_28860 [Mesorhizobium sp. B2-4-3]